MSGTDRPDDLVSIELLANISESADEIECELPATSTPRMPRTWRDKEKGKVCFDLLTHLDDITEVLR